MVQIVTAKQLRDAWESYKDYDAFALENGTLITALDDDNVTFYFKKFICVDGDFYRAERHSGPLADGVPVRLIPRFESAPARDEKGHLIKDNSAMAGARDVWLVSLGPAARKVVAGHDAGQAKRATA